MLVHEGPCWYPAIRISIHFDLRPQYAVFESAHRIRIHLLGGIVLALSCLCLGMIVRGLVVVAINIDIIIRLFVMFLALLNHML